MYTHYALPLQKACVAAGLEYDSVISQDVVWQTPAQTGADGADVKPDGEDVKPVPGRLTCCACMYMCRTYT